jgi:hypothetical protein
MALSLDLLVAGAGFTGDGRGLATPGLKHAVATAYDGRTWCDAKGPVLIHDIETWQQAVNSVLGMRRF